MSASREVKQGVINLLQTLPVCVSNTSGTQWTVRCPYCGDSMSLDHGHFSIAIDVDSDDPMLYHCFKCPSGGLLTPQVLEDLEVGYHGELYTALKAMNKFMSSHGKKFTMGNQNYVVPIFSGSRENLEKLAYVNQRLGLDLDLVELQKIKVILDLFEFAKANEIEKIPMLSWQKLQFINQNYVGFLSSNNNVITWRCIRDNKAFRRYDKMVLDPRNYSQNTFYGVPNGLDLLYTDEIHIHIAEGTFDILSVYYNLRNRDLDHNYYYAACGFGMQSIIRYLLYLGFNTGLNYHVYSDNDKSDKDHRRYLESMSNRIWLDRIMIHRNQAPNEKDYGVPLSRIIDGSRILK